MRSYTVPGVPVDPGLPSNTLCLGFPAAHWTWEGDCKSVSGREYVPEHTGTEKSLTPCQVSPPMD